jgi:thioesterase domain-containing protein
MTSLAEMIAELNARGIVLWREGDDIRYRAQRGVFTPAMLVDLRANRSRLLPLLGTRAPSARSETPNIVLLDRADTSAAAFCVHAVDGGVGSYIALAHELASAGISTYGVQALNLDGRTPLADTLPAIAAQHVHQLRSVHGLGPVHLVGWSSGALIAFEMAHRLSRLGAEVGEVILMDPPITFGKSPAIDPTGLATNLRSLLPPFDESNGLMWWKFLTLISAYIDSSASYQLAPHFWTTDDAGKSEYLFANRHDPLLVNPNCMLADARDAGDVLYMFSIVKQQHAALDVYRPCYFDGKLSLFVSAEGSSEQQDLRIRSATRTWQRLSQGIAHAEVVSGGHIDMLSNPCVARIARRIQTPAA